MYVCSSIYLLHVQLEGPDDVGMYRSEPLSKARRQILVEVCSTNLVSDICILRAAFYVVSASPNLSAKHQSNRYLSLRLFKPYAVVSFSYDI
jgi:hypothetical protein